MYSDSPETIFSIGVDGDADTVLSDGEVCRLRDSVRPVKRPWLAVFRRELRTEYGALYAGSLEYPGKFSANLSHQAPRGERRDHLLADYWRLDQFCTFLTAPNEIAKELSWSRREVPYLVRGEY